MTTTVVTGCSTGIGYAAALRFARLGHDVVATMRSPDVSDLPAIAKDEGLNIETRRLDVDDDASVGELFEHVVASRGRVDVLVNNAGLGGSGGVTEETGLDVYRTVMETNFFGAMRCIKAVLPSMRENGSGAIVNVTSQAGRMAMPAMSAYCASKWALEAASESLAIEVAPFGIRVALIEPGMILTPIWTKVDMTPPSGPYKPIRNRLGAVVLEEMTAGSSADEVADCIAEAVETDPPRLRWLVGQGAERNIRNRARWSDEEWSALWNDPDRERFHDAMFSEDG